jgi:hypothetical protein
MQRSLASILLIALAAASRAFAQAPVVTGYSPGNGMPGDTITITGSGFTGATAVQFNGVNATTIDVVSDSEMTAVVPVGATDGPITVVTPGGSASTVLDFTVAPDAPPEFTSQPNGGIAGTTYILAPGTSLSLEYLYTGEPKPSATFCLNGTPLAYPGSWGMVGDGQGVAPEIGYGEWFFSISDTSWFTALNIDGATDAASGEYTFTISNAQGSVVSPQIAVAVEPLTFTPGSGSPGDTITLNAPSGFTGATSVVFTPASPSGPPIANFTVVSDSEITAEVPAEAASGSITVNSPAGIFKFGSFTVITGATSVIPIITTQPVSQSVNIGSDAVFSVTATSDSPLNYQWYFNDNPIAGATGATLTLGNVQESDAGSYSVMVTDGDGNGGMSNAASLTVDDGTAPPSIAIQPASQDVNAGSDVVLAVTATSDLPLSYQWYFDGSPIDGATGAMLSMTSVQAVNDGTYTVDVTDGAGNETTSDGATLTVDPVPSQGIATQPVSQTIQAGSTVVFTVTASGSVQSSSIAELKGPSAKVTGSATYQWQFNGTNLADGNGVSGSAGPQLVIQGANATESGDYCCLVTTGGVAAESNSASLLVATAPNPGYLVNLSARGFVGTGSNVLIGGFYIVGSTSRTVLVQALGPALSGESVSGVLQHPMLTIHDSTGATIYSDTGWGSRQLLLNAAAAVYANPVLKANSGDSEVLLTLPPGGYTAEISGADGGAGVALCAIYQLP